MENIVDYLKQLDLSDIEAKLYLTLLQIGPTSVRDLALTIEIKRTTAYFYIDQLVDKGLLMKLVKGSKKLVAANEPENLRELIEEKLASAKAVQQGFPDILKALNTTIPQGNNSNNAEVKYYKGKNGVKKIYEEALKAKELRSYVDISKIFEVLPENYTLFSSAFKNNPHMQMFELVENSSESKKYVDGFNNMKNHFAKLLPEDTRLTAQDILIYDNNVAIINLKDDINGLVLHNTDLYNNFKLLFDFIWKIIPD
jgi:HTH-type transcriptional regulator, sugar sensing transcriptional regulator